MCEKFSNNKVSKNNASETNDDMGSKRAIDQVNDDNQTLGKYPIRVRVRVRVSFQLPMEQTHKLRIIIN